MARRLGHPCRLPQMRRFELSGVGRLHLVEPPTGDGPGDGHPGGPDPGVHAVAPGTVGVVDQGPHAAEERVLDILQEPQRTQSAHQHDNY